MYFFSLNKQAKYSFHLALCKLLSNNKVLMLELNVNTILIEKLPNAYHLGATIKALITKLSAGYGYKNVNV